MNYDPYNPNFNAGSPALYHAPSREDLQNLRADIQQLGATVQGGTAIISQSHQQMVSELAVAMKKNRKSKTRQEVAITSSRICIIQYYDDGSQDVEALFDNVDAHFEIARIVYPKESNEKWRYRIRFLNCDRNVIFKADANPRQMYDAFVEAGILFNRRLSEKRITAALADFFLHRVRECCNEKMFPWLAGWTDGSFFHKACVSKWMNYRYFPDIPVLHKELFCERASNLDICNYFNQLRMVREKKARMWLFVMPYYAILKSLLGEGKFFINIVTASSRARIVVPYFAQTFNRYRWFLYAANNSAKDFKDILGEVRDEVLLLDATVLGEYSVYERKKSYDNMNRLIQIATGKQDLQAPYHRPADFVLCILSDIPLTEYTSANIVYIDKDDIPDYLVQSIRDGSDVVGKVLASFVDYAEKEMPKIQQKLKKINCADESTLFETLKAIIAGFFNTFDVEPFSEHGLDVSAVDTKSLFSREDGDGGLEIFRKMVRKEMENTVAIEKRKADYADESIVYYGEEFLWIPSTLLNFWLKENRILYQRKRILAELKKEGQIICTEGYTYKLQIKNKRFETLMIRREFFTKTGEIDIIDLAGGDEL